MSDARTYIFVFLACVCVCTYVFLYFLETLLAAPACGLATACHWAGPVGCRVGGAWRWRRWRWWWWWWCVLVRGGVAVARRWCGGGRGLVTLVFVFLWVSVYRWAHQKTPEEVGDPQTPKKGNNACMIADFHCCWAQCSQKRRAGPLQMASL